MFNQKTKAMKKNPSSAGRSYLLNVLLALSTVTALFFSSCADHKNGTPAPETNEFRMNCVMLSRAQVQSWVDSGWTKSGTGAIKEILLQFYSASAADAATNMQLIAYPGESALLVKKNGSQLLTIDTSCKAVSFSGNIILANIQVELSKLGILNEDGTLKEFDHIRFTPVKFSKNESYISFNADVMVKGAPQQPAPVQLPPCPPWCCPPHCD